MASRLELHRKLLEVLKNDNVYFQPPNNFKLHFPCIIYELGKLERMSADNMTYAVHHMYTVALIHDDPDNTVKEDLIESFSMCRFSNSFVSDGKYHYVYEIFY